MSTSIMPTLGGMLDRETDREKAEVIKSQILRIQGEQGGLRHETTYFQHKAPDYLSFNVDLLQGSIADVRGGYIPWKVKFIPEIKSPYKSGYLDWMNRHQKIIDKNET